MGEVTIGGRAGRCVREGKMDSSPHPPASPCQADRAREQARLGSEGGPGNELQELALISTNREIRLLHLSGTVKAVDGLGRGAISGSEWNIQDRSRK